MAKTGVNRPCLEKKDGKKETVYDDRVVGVLRSFCIFLGHFLSDPPFLYKCLSALWTLKPSALS